MVDRNPLTQGGPGKLTHLLVQRASLSICTRVGDTGPLAGLLPGPAPLLTMVTFSIHKIKPSFQRTEPQKRFSQSVDGLALGQVTVLYSYREMRWASEGRFYIQGCTWTHEGTQHQRERQAGSGSTGLEAPNHPKPRPSEVPTWAWDQQHHIPTFVRNADPRALPMTSALETLGQGPGPVFMCPCPGSPWRTALAPVTPVHWPWARSLMTVGDRRLAIY